MREKLCVYVFTSFEEKKANFEGYHNKRMKDIEI